MGDLVGSGSPIRVRRRDVSKMDANKVLAANRSEAGHTRGTKIFFSAG